MLDISRAFAEDHKVTTIIQSMKLIVPFTLRRLVRAYMPSDRVITDDAINGHMYGIY
ncbi:MAG: hypothetical protein GX227_02040 [Clostridiaceae bacterium]|nr:hypothetical protein [Clostridiaceae bacterium]